MYSGAVHTIAKTHEAKVESSLRFSSHGIRGWCKSVVPQPGLNHAPRGAIQMCLVKTEPCQKPCIDAGGKRLTYLAQASSISAETSPLCGD